MGCEIYPKIDTLFTRDDKHVITNIIRRPEFHVPNGWYVTEKIDGTNIRISLELTCKPIHQGQMVDCDCGTYPENWGIVIRGRTSRAQIPTLLFETLQKTFTAEGLRALWLDDKQYGITLYGEGYGGGIQKGGGDYTSKTKGGAASFRLFDVFIGETWLDRFNVEDIAQKLRIETAPLVGDNLALATIVDMVKLGMDSKVAYIEGTPDKVSEGVVAFTNPPLFNSRGKRLMFKLKTKDFEGVPTYTRTDSSPPVTLTQDTGDSRSRGIGEYADAATEHVQQVMHE